MVMQEMRRIKTGLETGVELRDENGTRTRNQDRERTRTEAGHPAKGWCSTSLRTEANWQRGRETEARRQRGMEPRT